MTATVNMSYARRCSDMPGRAGFTLVEMAVVIVIAGIILIALLPSLIAVRRAGQVGATQTNLQALLRATAAYVQAQGCLPCPSLPALGTKFGAVGTTDGAPCGLCPRPDGVPPFVALGVDPATAKDGWGRWITMHIDPFLAQNLNAPSPIIVPPQAPCTENDSLPCQIGGIALSPCVSGCAAANKGQSTKGFCRANLANLPGAQPVTIMLPSSGKAMAAVIFVSHGVNGYGAYRPEAGASIRLQFPASIAACGSGRHYERCNVKYDPASANQTDGQFYWLDRGDFFDDVVAYAGRNMLVSMFGNGACATAW